MLIGAATSQAAPCQAQSVCGDRQKTVDQKTYCPCYNSTKRIVGGKGRGFWCGSCLYIRMGENIHEVRQRRDWRCPCCRDICNCSGANCLRARRNLAVTNQLIHEATKQGFKSVGRVLTCLPPRFLASFGTSFWPVMKKKKKGSSCSSCPQDSHDYSMPSHDCIMTERD